MEKDQHIIRITPAGIEATVEIEKPPHMGLVFLKALMMTPFRPNTLTDDAVVPQTRIILQGFQPDPSLISRYRTICGFTINNDGAIPITYLQTLFIGILGRFIISPFFPLKPTGLIQVFQSFEQKRPVNTGETLDLACILSGFTKKEAGIETRFILEVRSGGEIVWQGISGFFTRSGAKKAPSAPKPEDIFLEERETIPVPSGTGLRYAAVSGDYNPHHLYTFTARLFGFKTAIAHGMWSLARVTASLEREFDLQGTALIEASFKLPVFMPAVTTLGWEPSSDEETGRPQVRFELRDRENGLPHLKGRLLLP